MTKTHGVQFGGTGFFTRLFFLFIACFLFSACGSGTLTLDAAENNAACDGKIDGGFVCGEFLVSFAPVPENTPFSLEYVFKTQRERLESEYPLEVVRMYAAISSARRGGVFFVRRNSPDVDAEELLESLRSDPFIEAAEKNAVQSISSASSVSIPVKNENTTDNGNQKK